MKKKFLSLALALTMCLGLLVVPASAAGATVVKTLESGYEESFHYQIYSDGMLVVEKMARLSATSTLTATAMRSPVRSSALPRSSQRGWRQST